MSTICAVSTPHAVGGISVIRISGEKAIEISGRIFSTTSQTPVEKMEGYTCCYGKIIFEGREIDDGILTVFRAPRSFTGEDVCEISCHGGIFVTNLVLRAIISNGAEPAQAGEFTKRAFLNGKLSLTQAEAVMDVINAQGEQALRVAVSSHEGALYKNIREISLCLVSLLGELAAWVDYPEEDLPDIEYSAFKTSLENSLIKLEALLATYDTGRIIRQGIDTAIVGKPNVGKSTLMNFLLGFERSIVTDIEGTTRDIVEENVKIGDFILRLSDTAGIRSTEDIVESAGVSLSYKKINQADLVIAVFDNARELSTEDLNIVEKIKDKNAICVINKSDLPPLLDKKFLADKFNFVVEISAKDKTGLKEIENALEAIFMLKQLDFSAGIVANERQRKCVKDAHFYLKEALDILSSGETYDAVTVLIDKSAQSLLELTGERVTDNVVSEVFSRFCVGK